jgi:NADPH:quinone reductase-like Zn-dependent oxidoreductase
MPMKTIVITQYGPPDGLELKEVPKPTPKDDGVLIRVRASSINSWDWEFLNGTPFINRLMFELLKPKTGKQILGADIARTVESIGGGITRFRRGDEVFGDLWTG